MNYNKNISKDGSRVALLNNLRHSPCLEIILVILCNILNYKILLRMGITCDSIISGTRPLDIFRRLAIIGVDFKIFRIAVVFLSLFFDCHTYMCARIRAYTPSTRVSRCMPV